MEDEMMATEDLELEVQRLREELLATRVEKDLLREWADNELYRLSNKLNLLRAERSEQIRNLQSDVAHIREGREEALVLVERQDEELRRIDHELCLDGKGRTRADGDRVRALRDLTAKWKAGK